MNLRGCNVGGVLDKRSSMATMRAIEEGQGGYCMPRCPSSQPLYNCLTVSSVSTTDTKASILLSRRRLRFSTRVRFGRACCFRLGSILCRGFLGFWTAVLLTLAIVRAVIGDVPSTSLEDHARRMEYLTHCTIALRAICHRRITEPLLPFKAMAAITTFIFVQRH